MGAFVSLCTDYTTDSAEGQSLRSPAASHEGKRRLEAMHAAGSPMARFPVSAALVDLIMENYVKCFHTDKLAIRKHL
jgi:hypothetical protein